MILVTTKELADHYGVKPGTIRQWRARGHLPAPDPVALRAGTLLWDPDKVHQHLAEKAAL